MRATDSPLSVMGIIAYIYFGVVKIYHLTCLVSDYATRIAGADRRMTIFADVS